MRTAGVHWMPPPTGPLSCCCPVLISRTTSQRPPLIIRRPISSSWTAWRQYRGRAWSTSLPNRLPSLPGRWLRRSPARGRIGAVFGARLETTEAIAAGYIAGAREVNPDLAVDVRYLTAHPNLSGFGDVAGQERAAMDIFETGADVVLGDAPITVAARLSADGQQRWAIGSDLDRRAASDPAQAAVVLTSVLIDRAGATEQILELISDGRSDDDLTLGLVSGLTSLGGRAAAAAPYEALLADLEAQISSGAITVPVTVP